MTFPASADPNPLPPSVTPSREVETPPRYAVKAAIEASWKSPCQSKRGVAVFNRVDVIEVGHNHKAGGFSCDGSAACKAFCRIDAIHAEQHALLSRNGRFNGADMLHVKTVDGALVPSGGPSCVQCSKLMLAGGVAGMWLYHADGWRRYDIIEFHRLSLEAALLSSPAPVPPVPQVMEQLLEIQALLGCYGQTLNETANDAFVIEARDILDALLSSAPPSVTPVREVDVRAPK